MSTDNYGPGPQDGSYPPAPGYPPAAGGPAAPYGSVPPPAPGYGQSGPAPAPTPGYGQVPPASPYSPVPMAPDPYAQQSYGAPMGQPVLADWVTRAKGALIDWGPVIAIGIINYILAFANVGWLGSLLSLAGLAWMIYNTGYLAGTTGQSFGRKWAGTRLISEQTGQPIGAGMGIVRYLCHFVDTLLCGFGGFLFPLFTPKKQTIADMIVKTLVVVDQK